MLLFFCCCGGGWWCCLLAFGRVSCWFVGSLGAFVRVRCLSLDVCTGLSIDRVKSSSEEKVGGMLHVCVGETAAHVCVSIPCLLADLRVESGRALVTQELVSLVWGCSCCHTPHARKNSQDTLNANKHLHTRTHTRNMTCRTQRLRNERPPLSLRERFFVSHTDLCACRYC